MSEKNLDRYIAYKGYKTDFRQQSLNNLKDLIEEQEELYKRAERRRSTLAEPVSALASRKEPEKLIDPVMSVDTASKRRENCFSQEI